MIMMYCIFLHKYTVYELDKLETHNHNFDIYCVTNTLEEAYQNALLHFDVRLDELKEKYHPGDYYSEIKNEDYIKNNERNKFKIGYLVSGVLDQNYEEIWMEKLYRI